MEVQLTIGKAPVIEKDIVYTDLKVAKDIIKFLDPKGICLDPCKGEGVFFDNFPADKDYCEITEEKNFLLYNKKVDWVIGNPPYSIFEDFLKKAFEISNNVSYLVPTNKIFQRQIIMEMINNFGGLKSIIVYGSGSQINFPFGFSVGNFHIEKGYKGPTRIIMGMKKIKELI